MVSAFVIGQAAVIGLVLGGQRIDDLVSAPSRMASSL